MPSVEFRTSVELGPLSVRLSLVAVTILGLFGDNGAALSTATSRVPEYCKEARAINVHMGA